MEIGAKSFILQASGLTQVGFYTVFFIFLTVPVSSLLPSARRGRGVGKKKADTHCCHESAKSRQYMSIQAGIFSKENNCGKLVWPSATP